MGTEVFKVPKKNKQKNKNPPLPNKILSPAETLKIEK